MNEGYVSIIMMAIIVILLASGWKSLLFGGIPAAWIAGFVPVWIVFAYVNVPAGGNDWNGTYLLLAFVALASLAMSAGWLERFQLLASGVMLGLFGFLVQSLADSAPLVMERPQTFLTVTIALLIVCMYRRPAAQIGCLTIAILTEVGLQGYALSAAGPVRFPYGPWQDHWWTYLVITRLGTLAMASISGRIRLWSGRLAEKWKKARE